MPTQNPYLIKTENRFLPIIQAFTDNLYKNMQMRQELADKTMAFNMKKQGEALSLQYINRLKEAKTAEDIVSGFTDAYVGLVQKGLSQYAPYVSQYADLKSKELGILEEKDLYSKKFEALTKALGNNEFKFGEGIRKGEEISNIIKSQTANPKLQYELFKESVESGLLKTSTSLQYSPDLKNLYATDELIDKTGKVVVKPGEQPVKKQIIESKGQYYYDVGTEANKLDAKDVLLSGDALEKISALKYQDYWKRITDQRVRDNANGMDILKMGILKDKPMQEAYRQSLLNFRDVVSRRDPKNKSLIDALKYKVLGLDSKITELYGTDLKLTTPVNYASVTTEPWRDVTKSLLGTMSIKDYMGEGNKYVKDIEFDVIPRSQLEKNMYLTSLNTVLPSEWGIPAKDENGAVLNPETVKAFKEIDPSGELFKSLYQLKKLEATESGKYIGKVYTP
ncbi:hypothetical protein [Immundisolibacter sp.]